MKTTIIRIKCGHCGTEANSGEIPEYVDSEKWIMMVLATWKCFYCGKSANANAWETNKPARLI